MALNVAPKFRLTANSEDITEIVRQRLMSLTLTDEPGLKSDKLTIDLADFDPQAPIALPPAGAELELWLGYDNVAQYMGLFVVDDLDLAGPPDKLTIHAHASPFKATPSGKSGFQSQKTRSWEEGTTLGEMVSAIAAEHGLVPAVSEDLAAIVLPHTDQVNESDMNLLTRIVRPYGAFMKPAGGRLLVIRRGQGKTVGGEQMPLVAVSLTDVTSWTASFSERGKGGTVVAMWRDKDAGQDVEVSVGDGEPIKRIRDSFSDEASARAAAKTSLENCMAAKAELTLNLPGDPGLMAESRLTLSGFRQDLLGEWIVKRVVHSLGPGGYKSTVTAGRSYA